ncbi:MAG TPA: HD domain-containing phosphohydrolase [Anaerolineales bacterium]|nr:HD domain-containing phosphohydrolase [Anaerolineales bacterium]
MTDNKIVQLLRESEHFTQILLSIIEEGMIVCDHDFQIQSCNKFMEEMTGLQAEQLIQHWLFTIFPSLATPLFQEMLQRGLMGETVIISELSYQSVGSEQTKWYRGKISPFIGVNGESQGLILLFNNITAEKEAAENQLELANSLQNQEMLTEALGRIIFANTISTSLIALLTLICQESAFLFNASSVQVWLQRDEEIIKIAEHTTETDTLWFSKDAYNPHHIASQVIFSKKPYLINGYSEVQTHLSVMAVPLLKGEQSIGSLIIGNYPFHRFSTYDLEIALQFGGYAAIAVESSRLYEEIIQANEKLIHTYDSTLAGWAKALELRDRETEGHTQRVTNGCMILARAMGIDDEHLVHIYRGALLHDIGKMGIPDNILRKPGKLSEEEWKIMRLHPVYAYQWLNPIEFLHPALEIPYCHHEKWDGTGYPRGLMGPDIPLAARIFSVIDVWDALSFDRPYRKAWPPELVLEYIKEKAGTHFDPEIVAKFLEIYHDLSPNKTVP